MADFKMTDRNDFSWVVYKRKGAYSAPVRVTVPTTFDEAVDDLKRIVGLYLMERRGFCYLPEGVAETFGKAPGFYDAEHRNEIYLLGDVEWWYGDGHYYVSKLKGA